MNIRQSCYVILLAVSWVALGARPLEAQAGPACAGETACAEVSSFVATVSDFRQSVSGTYRLVTATVRFQNKTAGPLVLGYVSGSGLVTDDQGNRYAVNSSNGVRGIGQITGNTYDPKFLLQPGESSDARFEFVWQPRRGDIYGTQFEIDLAVREIEPVTANQHRLGREHALNFSGFGETAVAQQPASATPAAPVPVSEPVAVADPCAGESRCHHAGSFVAEVTRINQSKQGPYNDYILEATVRFTNLATEPLILGYISHSSVMVDDVGNRYGAARPGTHDTSVRGIGLVTGRSADPSFQLKPREAREATFKVWFRAGKKQVGTRYAFDFSVEQLEILPSQQIRSVREYAVGFRDLSTGSWSAGKTLDSLVGDAVKAIGKKK